ncbi:translation initiation factor IF-2 N-terminal domain-containing protein [Lactococcus lactis]|nr:translation initiation factor IF-2 N-terminal domain-containing protein [Lactococcus lactis]
MKKRIYQLAKEVGCSNQELLERAQKLGFAVTTASSGLSEEETQQLLNPPKRSATKTKAPSPKVPKSKPSKQIKKVKTSVFPQLSDYEKKPAKKAKPPEVKTLSPKRAHHYFVFVVLLFHLSIAGLGAVGVLSEVRMNQLVRQTNQVIKNLNQENEAQSKAISQLEQKQSTTSSEAPK